MEGGSGEGCHTCCLLGEGGRCVAEHEDAERAQLVTHPPSHGGTHLDEGLDGTRRGERAVR